MLSNALGPRIKAVAFTNPAEALSDELRRLAGSRLSLDQQMRDALSLLKQVRTCERAQMQGLRPRPYFMSRRPEGAERALARDRGLGGGADDVGEDGRAVPGLGDAKRRAYLAYSRACTM